LFPLPFFSTDIDGCPLFSPPLPSTLLFLVPYSLDGFPPLLILCCIDTPFSFFSCVFLTLLYPGISTPTATPQTLFPSLFSLYVAEDVGVASCESSCEHSLGPVPTPVPFQLSLTSKPVPSLTGSLFPCGCSFGFLKREHTNL